MLRKLDEKNRTNPECTETKTLFENEKRQCWNLTTVTVNMAHILVQTNNDFGHTAGCAV